MIQKKFSKSQRLLKAEDFFYLKEGSFCLKAPNLIVYAKKSRLGSPLTRIGISVSKKVGKSCQRNRLKRIIRESFRLSDICDLGFDLLFVVNPGLLKHGPDAERILRTSLLQLFNLLLKKK